MKTVTNFKAWAYEKAREFDQFKKEHGYICCCFYKRKTVLVNLKNGKTWTATCRKSEPFDSNIGIGVAFARFLNEEIPVELEGVYLSSLNYGDKFTNFVDTEIYVFVAKEPVLNRYIYISEKTKRMFLTSCNLYVYKV